VKLADNHAVNHQAVSGIHGRSFDELQELADGGVAEVGQHCLQWLEAVMQHITDA
jgi:hypothetical protein